VRAQGQYFIKESELCGHRIVATLCMWLCVKGAHYTSPIKVEKYSPCIFTFQSLLLDEDDGDDGGNLDLGFELYFLYFWLCC
jgi:hypothetical protein